ncbi:aminoglycoside phosphotransferase family protein [Roseibium marinum]|uniref:Streptomycin 6-kinase n=1 Tax=Roseibium marinum TaxID=281252 RepID=A0A2S3UYW0_9HYPH|nr:aminoglycoside phosphotransferase family protein [Roseibium marinum]POF32911.1 streptomycin 6-kinase [Roseibium marinum]
MPDPVVSAPENLSWLNRTEAGRNWLSSLPDLVSATCNRFGLELDGPPFSGGSVSYVVPVRQAGKAAVLKLQFADRESRHEADALKAWNGTGAIRLLHYAPETGVLLLERCHPGHFLADDPSADKLAVLADILRKLLVPAGKPFNALTDEAAIWVQSMEKDWRRAGKPCEKRLVDAAVAALTGLSSQDTAQVLLHQDLHGHNVLAGDREPWLAIDPKPLAGDPAFCLSPIVRSFEFGHSKSAALYRLDRLSEELEADRERARLWTIGQTMAWAFSSSWSERHFETTRWLLD